MEPYCLGLHFLCFHDSLEISILMFGSVIILQRTSKLLDIVYIYVCGLGVIDSF